MDSNPGVSRSGRIRKKSSKYVDYESIDEVPEANRRSKASLPVNQEEKEDDLVLTDEDYAGIPVLGAEWDSDSYDPDFDKANTTIFNADSGNVKSASSYLFSSKSAQNNINNNNNNCIISPFTSWAKVSREGFLRSSPRLNSSSKLHQALRDAWGNLSKKERVLWANRSRRYGKYIQSRTSGLKVIKGIIMEQQESSNSKSLGNSKVVGTDPIDSAAHLKLLGESLSIIGERLTEHEGQIAVSGSLSVLLDSLLCAMGPLMCLTQQVPELNTVPQNRLSSILDNVAYIMPGL